MDIKKFERWLWNMSMGWNTNVDRNISEKIHVNKVQPEDIVTYGKITITAIKGETLQQFANRINEITGAEIAIVTGNPNDLVKKNCQ